jgi:hypothetical protein
VGSVEWLRTAGTVTGNIRILDLILSKEGQTMNSSQIFIILSIAALIFVVILFLAVRKKGKKLTPFVGFAWALVLAGIIFGEDRLIGYSLIGVGVVLAVMDMIITPKSI